jgi:hypothetical protein
MPIFPASLASIFAALKRHITLALFAVALLASALLVHSWISARRAATQLAATLATQQKITSDADARQSARDAALSQTLAQIDALKRRVQTPQQASAALAQSLPQFIAGSITPAGEAGPAPLPAPLQFIPQAESSAPPTSSPISPNLPVTENLGSLSTLKSQILNLKAAHPVSRLPSQPPTALQQGAATAPIPGSICIPPADLKPLFDSIENCEACAAKLTASQADLTDEHSKFIAATAQRDAALKAAHGTFWTRAARAAKWIAIGVAAGAVLARYH